MALTHANKAVVALASCVASAVAIYFHKDLGMTPEGISEVTTVFLPLLVYFVPNLAPYIEDGGKLDNVEQLAADIATKVKDNVNAAHADVAASEAEAEAGVRLSDPTMLRAPDGMQRPS